MTVFCTYFQISVYIWMKTELLILLSKTFWSFGTAYIITVNTFFSSAKICQNCQPCGTNAWHICYPLKWRQFYKVFDNFMSIHYLAFRMIIDYLFLILFLINPCSSRPINLIQASYVRKSYLRSWQYILDKLLINSIGYCLWGFESTHMAFKKGIRSWALPNFVCDLAFEQLTESYQLN